MNKKIFKSLFMGALLVGSVGTLTSCSKDYDNDINDLKAQIAKLATTETLNAKVTELQTSIASVKTSATAAQTTATTALNNAATNATALATLKSSVSDLSALVATKADQTAFNAAIANMNSLLANKVDQSAYNTKIADLESYIKTNSANIDKNTAALEAYKKVVDEKINAIVADIEAKYATKEALNEAVTNLTTQLGALPTKDYVAEQIAAAVKNLANKDDVTAEIAAAVKGLASEEYVTNAIKDLASKSDVATAKEEVLKAMSENNDALKAYIAAAIASQADIDAANLAAKVKEINDLIKSNKDESDAALAAAKIELSQQINSVKSTLETQFNTNLAEAVSNLTTLINGKASAEELAAAKTALQDEIDAATGRIGDLETAVGDLKTRVGALETNLNNKVEIADFNTAISALTGSYKGMKSQIDALMTKINNMVTSVDLYTGEENIFGRPYMNRELDFYSYKEKATKFGVNGQEVTFTNGIIKSTEDQLMIRVSPNSVTLNEKGDSISLMNSQNQDLSDYIEIVSCLPYKGLITRADNQSTNGLWVLTFKLKDGMDADAFSKAINATNGRKVKFCVAIKSGLTDNRAVISSYDVTVNAYSATPQGELNYTVNNTVDTKAVSAIHNRYDETESRVSTKNVSEKTWKGVTTGNIITGYKTVYTPYIESEISSTNTVDKPNSLDNRQILASIPAYLGQKITISFTEPVRAFYVALDSKNALESDGSEIVAWETYAKTIDNLGHVFGDENGVTTGDITINSAVIGDKIGFRVYAVNFDGTLVDPDGRAFYVVVANKAQETNISTTLIPTKAGDNYSGKASNTADLSDLLKTASVVTTQLQSAELFFIRALDKDGNELANSGNDTFAKDIAAKASKIASFQSYVKDPMKFDDGGNVIQQYDFKDANGAVIRTITVDQTKKMPTATPDTFSAKANQFVGGVFYCYLTPIASAPNAATGSMELYNAFNGLYNATTWDEGYQFVFAKAGANDADIKVDYNSTVTGAPYKAIVPKASVLNGDKAYETAVNYVYYGISSATTDGNWPLQVGTFKTTFRSYLSDKSHITWIWNNKENAQSVVYGVDANIEGNTITETHDYPTAAYSGKDLKTLVDEGKLSDVEAHLYSNAADEKTKDEYFKVTYVGTTTTNNTTTPGHFKFVATKTSTESAPKANVVSILKITAKDAYGKAVVLDNLTVTVKLK